MKKLLLTSLFFVSVFCTTHLVNAQMVYMPDSMLKVKLTNLGYGSCITGNYIESSCALIANVTVLDLSSSNIGTLEGITAFPSLRKLNCSANFNLTIPVIPNSLDTLIAQNCSLTNLPALPSGMIYLSVMSNQLSVLPTLPSGMINLDVRSNQLTVLPTLPSNLEILSCSNNQLTLLPVNLPATLIYLWCERNYLDTLPQLPNSLTFLDCHDNNINFLPSTLPANLYGMYCNINNLTFLPSLPSSLRYLSCEYNLISSLPVLPPNLYLLNCGNNQLAALPSLPASLNSLDCGYNQISNLPVLPNALENLVCWSNQLISLPDLPDHLYRLGCDNNFLTALPDLPDSMNYLTLEGNLQLNCLPQLKKINNLYFNNTPINCLPNYGTILNSQPSISTLPLCDQFNSHGCNFYWNISGKTFFDSDSNCFQSNLEPGLKNMHLKLFKSGILTQQAFTGGEGFYSFDIDNLGIYETTIDTINFPFTYICPTSGNYLDTLSLSDSLVYNNDFTLKCRTGFDVGAWSIFTTVLIPSHRANVIIHAGDIAKLYGVSCASGVFGSIAVTINGNAHYAGSVPGAMAPSSVLGNIVTYNILDFGTLNPNSDIAFQLEVDTIALVGTFICLEVNVNPLAGDNNVLNNSYSLCFIVQGSFDPNDKQVYPEGIIDTSQHWLTYTIRFQNTGTAPADHIYVLDTLVESIDLSTFQLLATSHLAYVQILDGGIARFNFPNINLPDSFTNEPLSHGYVQYKVKLKDNLPIGTQIRNTAYIYFDFNAPVQTNTTLNTIDISNGILLPKNMLSLNVWPIPFENSFMIQGELIKGSHYLIVDLLGNEMISGQINSTQMKINSESWSDGIYFLRVEGSSGTEVRKLIKK